MVGRDDLAPGDPAACVEHRDVGLDVLLRIAEIGNQTFAARPEKSGVTTANFTVSAVSPVFGPGASARVFGAVVVDSESFAFVVVHAAVTTAISATTTGPARLITRS